MQAAEYEKKLVGFSGTRSDAKKLATFLRNARNMDDRPELTAKAAEALLDIMQTVRENRDFPLRAESTSLPHETRTFFFRHSHLT